MPAATAAFTSAGSDIAISLAAPGTYNAAGFNALTFKSIGEVTDIPEFGKKFNKVEHKPLKTRRIQKKKGSYDNGSFTLALARAPGDLGQIDAMTARDQDAPAYFRVTLQDGTKMYYAALVMSYSTNIGSVDNITASGIEIEITDEIVEVAAP